MIKYHKDEKVKMSMIRYPADIREYTMLDKVKDLAKSIEDVGLLHKIVLRYGTREIIAGRHRAAAYLILNQKYGSTPENKYRNIPARIIETTDIGAQLISMHENAQRNHNSVEKDAAMEELVRLYHEYMKEDAKAEPYDAKGKKKKPSLKKAFEHVGNTLGLKPTTIKRQHYKKKKQRKNENIGVKALGMEITRPFQVSANAIQKLVWDVEWHIKKCVEALNKLDRCKLGFPIQVSDKIREDLRDSARFIHAFSPTHLCPYCKGLAAYQDNCQPCYGFGWVGSYVTNNVLEELMDEKQPCILINDQLTSLHDLLEEPQQLEAIIEEGEEWRK